jgi:DNA ligase 1
VRRFAQLYVELDASTSVRAKVDAMRRYFAEAAAADAAWAVYFLAGGKPRQTVGTRALREFALAATGLPDWLFTESYQAVGDLAETVALLLPPPARTSSVGLAQWMAERLLPLRLQSPAAAVTALRDFVDELESTERFVLIKLIGGGLRVGVSRALVTRALATFAGIDAKVVAQRLIGYADGAALPGPEGFEALCAPEHQHALDAGTPYPFFLAHVLDRAPADLGPRDPWLAGWKYAGIRAQLVRRAGDAWLWSRGEELITERFPEIAAASATLPDGTVLDGEVLVWDAQADAPASFARLQRRIGRKTLGARLLQELPARFLAFDLLEDAGVDLRDLPQRARRVRLEARVPAATGVIAVTPLLTGTTWDALAAARASSRARGLEGLMLKRADARYGVGRTKESGTWFKWKIDPMSVDAVLVYAQRGHGRRASLYTDYTFAVWDRPARQRGCAVGAVRESLLGPDRCGDPARGRGGPPHDRGEVRPGAQCDAIARVRDRLRGDPGVDPPSQRRGGAVPAHPALARGQRPSRCRYFAGSAFAVGCVTPSLLRCVDTRAGKFSMRHSRTRAGNTRWANLFHPPGRCSSRMNGHPISGGAGTPVITLAPLRRQPSLSSFIRSESVEETCVKSCSPLLLSCSRRPRSPFIARPT